MFDINGLIQSGGILIVALIVFAESGLLVGFFLPGDTLLLGAGILAAQGSPPIVPLILAIVAAAIIGDNVGYSIGRRTGHRIFNKKDSLFFQQEHLQRAEEFYEKHGGKTIILARFTPIVRTFAPVVAGAGKMPRRRFMLFNVIGAILWGAGITLLGYWFGNKIPHLEEYVHYVLFAVIVLSLGFSLLHLLREERIRKAIVQKLKNFWSLIRLNRRP